MRWQLTAGVAQRVRSAIHLARPDVECGITDGMMPVRLMQPPPLPGRIVIAKPRAERIQSALSNSHNMRRGAVGEIGDGRILEQAGAEAGLLVREIEQPLVQVLADNLALPQCHEGLE